MQILNDVHMDIFTLRNEMFTDLTGGMDFLLHKGFIDDDVVSSARCFRDTVYFYSNVGEWYSDIPECEILNCNINRFGGEEHTCTLDVGEECMQNIMLKLKGAAKMVFEGKMLKNSTSSCSTFEQFWKGCNVPKQISLTSFAFTKRGHRKQYINIYNSDQEITGSVDIATGSIVKCPVRWSISESGPKDRVEYGFRAHFGPGIRIIRMAGKPPPIKRPWDWDSVDFNTLALPMYKYLVVKTPALEIIKTTSEYVQVKLTKKPIFAKAMENFHSLANVLQWDGIIYFKTSKNARVGDFVLASVVPTRNTNNIQWNAQKFLRMKRAKAVVSREEGQAEVVGQMAGQKRDAGNMDNSPVLRTKRLCILNDIDVHTKV